MKAKIKAAVVVLLTVLSVGCASWGDSNNVKPVDQEADNTVDATFFAGPIKNLDFKAGDHRLSGSSRVALDELIIELARNPAVSISLGGHTDNRGSAAANLQLSKKRVMSVVRYLVSNGVEPTRLKPYGYGESQPIVSNATPEGRTKNRRIEVSVIEQ